MNKIFIMGRLGQEPDLKYTPSGKPVCKLSVATNDGTKEKPITSWHSVLVWEKQGENACKYLSKGKRVLIEGRVSYRQYTDKNDIKHSVTEIIAHTVNFIDFTDEQKPVTTTLANSESSNQQSEMFDDKTRKAYPNVTKAIEERDNQQINEQIYTSEDIPF